MGNNIDPLGTVLKLVLGDVPARGAIKLIIFGFVIGGAYFVIKDWKEDFEVNIKSEATTVRTTLMAYIAANDAWQNASKEERAKLIRKANARIRRLYEHNGWIYEEIEP